jgi:hypothetical protein
MTTTRSNMRKILLSLLVPAGVAGVLAGPAQAEPAPTSHGQCVSGDALNL